MAATEQNVTLFQGDEVILSFTIEDSAGVAQDISGATFQWALARSLDHVPALAVIAGSIADALNGIVEVNLITATTANLEGKYEHELVMDAGGSERTVAVGILTIKASVLK